MNPLHDEDMHAIMGANVLNGVDANCLAWIRKFREASMAPAGAAGVASAAAGDSCQPSASDSNIDARRREREERRRRRS